MIGQAALPVVAGVPIGLQLGATGTGGAILAVYEGDARPDRQWRLRHFRDPKAMSPGSIMPKFPLTEQELNDLTSYMLSLKKV